MSNTKYGTSLTIVKLIAKSDAYFCYTVLGLFTYFVVFQVYSKVTSIKLMNFGQIWS